MKKKSAVTGAFLASAALSALLVGCSSASSVPDGETGQMRPLWV